MTDDEIPTGFTVRSSMAIRVLFSALSVWIVVTTIIEPDLLGAAIAIGVVLASIVQWRWSAEISPDGLSLQNAVGASWHRPWSELRDGVRVRLPGTMGALIRAKAAGGRAVSIPNGVVRTTSGTKLAPETARSLIKTWADAGTAPAAETSADGQAPHAT